MSYGYKRPNPLARKSVTLGALIKAFKKAEGFAARKGATNDLIIDRVSFGDKYKVLTIPNGNIVPPNALLSRGERKRIAERCPEVAHLLAER